MAEALALSAAEQARLAQAADRAPAFTTDSRAFRPGDIFVALKGEKHDGHAFVPEILKNSPELVVVAQGVAAGAQDPRVLAVAHPHTAHRALAHLFRKKFKGPVIVVGGSSGKTSTKEFLAQILSAKFKVAKTEKSQNGELGIPKTMEQLRPGVDCAVIEVGIDAPHEMERHAQLVAADLAVLTSIGEEHMSRFLTLETVYREEKILLDVTLARGGIAFVSGADPWLRKLEGQPRTILVPADPTLYSPRMAQTLRQTLPNDYAVQNATLAIGIARQLGMKDEEILAVLPTLKLPDGRGGVLQQGEWTILADHYNSNPSSLKAGLQAAETHARRAKKALVLVLGDMLDLGESAEKAHELALKDIAALKPKDLVLIGPLFAAHQTLVSGAVGRLRTYADSATAAAALKVEGLEAGVVLLKGSRGMALEKVLAVLSV